MVGLREGVGVSRLIKRFTLVYGMLEQMPNLILTSAMNAA
jgi:hypothetical protein